MRGKITNLTVLIIFTTFHSPPLLVSELPCTLDGVGRTGAGDGRHNSSRKVTKLAEKKNEINRARLEHNNLRPYTVALIAAVESRVARLVKQYKVETCLAGSV